MKTELKPADVIAIEFDCDMNPLSIWTRDHWSERPEDDRAEQWDVEFSKTERQFYYHNSGSGPIYSDKYNPPRLAVSPARDFWVAEGVPFKVQGDLIYYSQWYGSFAAIHMLVKYPAPLRLASLPQSLDLAKFIDDAMESEVAYCGECDDWLPAETDYLCDHMQWCDQCGDHTVNRKSWRFWPGEYWSGFQYIDRCAECGAVRHEDDED